jgi:ribose-phosphate pyrophosphokinase
MKNILFALPGNELLTKHLASLLNAELGEAVIRQFPDGESYVQVVSDVKNKKAILVCTLHEPNEKLLSLYFLSKLLKDLGVKSTCLVTPYLAYMRQDKRFHPGEAVTSEYFGKFISAFADSLITIDPHLHRRGSLSEIYSIPSQVKHAANLISDWIKVNVVNPVLVGPDRESEQWVSEVAKNADAPYIVLDKIRHGDTDVEVSVPEVERYKNDTPVLVDDIISTARTMIETVTHLKKAQMKLPICIGVHAVFAGNAYENLQKAGVERIITCNTIPHETNGIDVSGLLVAALTSK